VLIKFDLSIIPNGSTITNAKMSLYTSKITESCCTPGVMMAQGTKYVYQSSTPWSENSVNWTNQPTSSTSIAATCTKTAVKVWEDYDVTNSIKTMFSNPNSNYGFVVKCAENAEFGIMMMSSQYNTDKTFRPKLTVTYEPKSNIIQHKIENRIIPAKEYNILVFNVQGKQISSFKIKNINELNSILPVGMHIVTINSQKMKMFKR